MTEEDLRRQEAMAALAQLSGDPILGRFGSGMYERASERRKGLTRARERAEEARRLKPSGMPGFMIQGNQVVPVPGYDEFLKKKHQRGLQLARERAKGGANQDWYQRQMWLRTMGTPSQMAEARKTMSYLPELQAQAQALQAEDVEIPAGWEAAADFARENLPLGANIAPGVERAGMTPSSVQWLERGRQAEQDVMRLASGLAVTGFELQNIKKWSPWAGNLTKQQRTDRLRNIYNKLGREATAYGGQVWQDVQSPVFLGQMTPDQIPPGGAPGQLTPQQVPPSPGVPGQVTPDALPQTRPVPQRPEGLSDEEWQRYLELEGYL